LYLLETQNINKSYADHQALTNISLQIPKQSIFGLLGPNGAGKTTLIRIITSILQADSGTILLNGKKIQRNHTQSIGYLPEERGLYKKMRVGEQLLYLARLKGMDRSLAIDRIKHWLQKLEMLDWRRKNIEDLSKGMQQKIQFIATVLHEPQLLILDEPFSGFDPINVNIIKDEILNLRDKGATVIFSTHIMESVEKLCDHIALLYKSKKILDGKKKDIKQQYRTNRFEIDHVGPLKGLGDIYKIMESRTLDENRFHSIVQIPEDHNPNQLLKELIIQTEIHKFAEIIPSMNEIFISKVNEQS
jgi:ABC-2 type transport system ATP-binding protein